MKNKKRKGFTLVELLVVIAILAILATVSILGYTSFTKKATISNDEAVCSQINLLLQADEQLGKPETLHDALQVVMENGYDVTKLTPTTQGYNYVYHKDTNRFELVAELGNGTANDWIFVDAKDIDSSKKYSVYLLGDSREDQTAALNVKAGIDVGSLTSVVSINYTNSTEQKVVIRTNVKTDLSINAPNDTVSHFGFGHELTISSIDTDCYNEFGTFGFATIEQGKFVVKNGGFIGELEVSGESKLENNGSVLDLTIADVSNYSGNGTVATVCATTGDTSKIAINKNYAIHNLDELLLFRDRVNTGYDFKGMNVTLEADIDLKNIEWVPIGTLEVDIIGPSSVEIEDINGFHGNFDGKNHTITNLSYSGGEGTEVFGFFGLITGEYVNPNDGTWKCDNIVPVTVKNIKFANVNIIGDSKTGVLASALQAVNVSNVEVTGTITAGDMGGISALACDCNFENCKTNVAFNITNRSSVKYSQTGGITGQFANNYELSDETKLDHQILNCDTSNCTYKILDKKEPATGYSYLTGKYIGQNLHGNCYNLRIDADHNGILEGDENNPITEKFPNPIN